MSLCPLIRLYQYNIFFLRHRHNIKRVHLWLIFITVELWLHIVYLRPTDIYYFTRTSVNCYINLILIPSHFLFKKTRLIMEVISHILNWGFVLFLQLLNMTSHWTFRICIFFFLFYYCLPTLRGKHLHECGSIARVGTCIDQWNEGGVGVNTHLSNPFPIPIFITSETRHPSRRHCPHLRDGACRLLPGVSIMSKVRWSLTNFAQYPGN